MTKSLAYPRLPFAVKGIESYYALDRICQLVYAARPKSLRIYCADAEMLMMAARRLYWLEEPLLVNNEALAERVRSLPGTKAVAAGDEAEAGLILFQRQNFPEPPKHKALFALADNNLSYKSLLYRKQVYDNSWALKNWFRQAYRIESQIGLFGGRFLWHWTLSQVMQNRDSALHFKHQQLGLDHIFDDSAFKDFAYLQILAGSRL